LLLRREACNTTSSFPPLDEFAVTEPEPLEIFWEIHSSLPREGPGDDTSTRRAFSMLAEPPSAPRMLDVGCGPGMQTLELARMTDGPITALDTHQPFLDELTKRAKEAGLSDRITAVRESMFAMPFRREASV
jgi:2-polyprenyl-3-methyl-5-hydroxy-6-metoxy-1,4-benzoquinol methylase